MAQIICENWNATVIAWFLKLPGHHPFWDCYQLAIVSLADFPGIDPAIKTFPDATHEFLFMALDPNHNPDPANFESIVQMHPINYVHQVNATDELAKAAGETIISYLEAGQLPAEPQGWQGAREIFARLIDDRIKAS